MRYRSMQWREVVLPCILQIMKTYNQNNKTSSSDALDKNLNVPSMNFRAQGSFMPFETFDPFDSFAHFEAPDNFS